MHTSEAVPVQLNNYQKVASLALVVDLLITPSTVKEYLVAGSKGFAILPIAHESSAITSHLEKQVLGQMLCLRPSNTRHLKLIWDLFVSKPRVVSASISF